VVTLPKRFPSVAFYGNNLDVGYRFVRCLSRQGWKARLFCIRYPTKQEYHEWWSNEPLDEALISHIDVADFGLYRLGRLTRSPEIRDLYDKVRQFDVLIVTENGPALFSELIDVPKIFFSFGSDLQTLPFLLRTKADLRGRAMRSLSGFGKAWREWLELVGYIFQQSRQRRGIRQACRLICSTHQLPLTKRLSVPRSQVELSLNIPMNADMLADVPADEIARARARYGSYDVVFFHPTRHLYLPLDGDAFLKDNHKLLHAYARFARETRLRVRLLLIRKGRPQDLAESEQIIARLGIADCIEWLPEMSNRALRALYSLENVVVCDQFNPNIAMLGSIGRETSFYGRPLITAFGEHNKEAYAHDWPPHVYAAATVDSIVEALRSVASLSNDERRALAVGACEWFRRNLDERALMPKYMHLIEQVATEARA
jgi:glycosyltransferase involved in cell wall biosynthesis